MTSHMLIEAGMDLVGTEKLSVTRRNRSRHSIEDDYFAFSIEVVESTSRLQQIGRIGSSPLFHS
jgi:hypothetical protein